LVFGLWSLVWLNVAIIRALALAKTKGLRPKP
jgi:hypothetical protein